MERIPVWIDCDPGVDDAVALFLAGKMEELELVGLSAVAGNVCLDLTLHNLLCLRELLNLPVPVYAGADGPRKRKAIDAAFFHGADGLGGVMLPEPRETEAPELAWDALYRAAKERPGALTLIAVGPLTNVATAFEKYPDLPDLLRQILLMGGAVQGGNRTAVAEFNIIADPEAAARVFAAPLPIVMCGLDVTLRAYVTAQELEEMVQHASREVTLLAAMQHNAFKRVTAQGAPGVAMHDPCPVLWAVYPELFRGRPAHVQVVTEDGPQLGRTVVDWATESNCLVVMGVNRERFLCKLREILGRYGA